ncbi:hypothetical protein [Mycolicibacterium fluoranthenivorans]|uniref:Uncharacterized protein n=1 Tax=Mycolicibacterium fluoranthenivorans TaxID=258505 RepID=A0A7X5U5M5_9MYCO|nr:hypothetical protein [Mycolicibacterium fluoranthenivorans]MCV7354521.1 hypothetical protein [Mycolicibacterium fluoranthenivorans]NIH98872.1 hypothetical protein [Mycolicibacterium fluoranthenivorans]
MRDPRIVETRYWNGTRLSLEELCRWANGFDPYGDPVLTFNFADDGTWDAPLLATEGDFRELRNGDYIVRLDDGEFCVRRLT